MSYDAVPELAAFAAKYGIMYPLLSDEGSHTIRAIGLENHKIRQHNDHYGRETTEKHRGLPYPGTFELGADGRIVAKRFDVSHRVRPSGAVLLRDVADEVEPEAIDRADVDGVVVEASVLRASYHPQQEQRLMVRLGIPAGRHVYVDPVPFGFTPLTVHLEGPRTMAVGTVGLPAGEPHQVPGFDADFHAVSGRINLPVSFRVDEDEGNVVLDVTVSFQSCTDRECFPPATVRLLLPLAAGGVLRRS